MKRFSRAAVLGATALAAGLVGTVAQAQVEIITVTAQKREQTLQEVPVAVTAVTGAVLEQAQIRDVSSLQSLVPSLSVATAASSTNTGFNIRGVGSSTFNFGLEPSVAVFVDGVYRARNGASINDFLGLERVEVLRGPQSTLFGKNTSAGVISFTTRAPEFEFGAEGEVTVGNYNARVVRGAVTGPLVEDRLAFRIDGNINQRDGFITNVFDGRDVNNRDRWSARGQLLFTPSADTSIRLIAEYGNIDERCCAAPFSFVTPDNALAFTALGVTQLPVNPNSGQVSFDGRLRAEVETSTYSAEFNRQFESFEVNYLVARQSYDESQDIDPDWVDQPFNNRRLVTQDYTTWTHDIRLTSTTSGAVDWMVGAYYFDQDLTATNSTIQGPMLRPFADLFSADTGGNLPAPFTGGSTVGFIEAICNVVAPTTPGCVPGAYLAAGSGLQSSRFDQGNTSWAAYGQFDFHLSDRFTITAGLRYTHERKNVDTDIVIDDPFAAVDLVQFSNALFFQQAFQTTFGVAPTPANIAAIAGNPATAPILQAVQAGAMAAATAPTNPFLGLGALQFFPPSPNFNDSRTDTNWSGTLIAAYDLTDNVNVYASYSTGYKAGGFALDASAARVGDYTFDPETSTSIELGLKSVLFDNMLQMNVAVFQQRTEDFQANVFTGSSFVPDNAGEILVRGIEVDGMFSPNPNFTMTGGFTYLFDMEYDEFINGPCPVADTSGCTFRASATSPALVPVQDLSGRRLSGAAKFTGNMTATYTAPITDALEGMIRGEVYYTSDRFLNTSLDPRQVQEGFALVNASVGVGSRDGGWQVQLWARNLLDEEYIQGSFDSTLPGNLNAYPGDPRTYGLTLRARF